MSCVDLGAIDVSGVDGHVHDVHGVNPGTRTGTRTGTGTGTGTKEEIVVDFRAAARLFPF